jgi:drug/metabolite transporter (DMT)-like permease
MSRRDLLMFASMCVIWGIPYLFIKVGVSELSPATLVFLRTATAALVLVPVALTRGGLRPLWGSWRVLLLFTFVEVAIPWFLLSSAEQRLSSSLTGLLISAVPLVAMVVTLALGNRERLGAASLVGLFIGVVGVAAIVGFDVRGASTLGLLETALVAVGYAVGPVILARYLSHLPSVSVIAAALLICAVVYAPIAFLQRPAALPSPSVLASVLVLGLVCTALAFLLFFALIASIGPVRSTVITYVNPAVAALLGVAVLHETFTAGMGLGFVLVLLGSVLATTRTTGAQRLVHLQRMLRRS